MLCTVKSALQGLCQQASAELAGEVETQALPRLCTKAVTATPLCPKVTGYNNQTTFKLLSSAVNTTEAYAAG